MALLKVFNMGLTNLIHGSDKKSEKDREESESGRPQAAAEA
jgi:hypothetical protein